MIIEVYGTPLRIARRGNQPALVDGGKGVLACPPGHPKEIVIVPIEDLPF